MLVLSRKPGESLRVGDDIRITVVSTASGQVRIGIEAPENVRIHREEVYERIVEANREAARASAEAPRTMLPPTMQKSRPSRGGSPG
jgi:carbon storage regulator